jgi:hypothetical protein
MSLHKVYRVATYVPPDAVEHLLAGICGVVQLRYGNYARSAWWLAAGTEQYEPVLGAQPSHGEVGKLSRVPSIRLEFCIPRNSELLQQVITAGLRPNHPWEEPAIFIDESLVDIRSGTVG